ncbi:uncharacterized protein LOC135209272 isoform X2 [Macrobrachium nipponense]
MYQSTKNEPATIPLPECDLVKIESRISCWDDYPQIELQVTWNNYTLNASSLFHCFCRRDHPIFHRRYSRVPLIQIEISRETLQASRYCDVMIRDPESRTLKGRTLIISSDEMLEWDLYIRGNCNIFYQKAQTWKTATFATGAVAILFLAVTISLAVYILLKKRNTRSLKGQTHLEMQNNHEMFDLGRSNATYLEKEEAIYDIPEGFMGTVESTTNMYRNNQALETNQQSPIVDSEMYLIPQCMQKGTETVYENVADRRQNNDNLYENLPVVRS